MQEQPNYQPPPYTQYPPPPPQKPSFWRRKVGCLPMWAIIIIAVLSIGAIGSVASNGASSGTSSITQSTASTPVPTATRDTSIPTSTPAPTQAPAKWRTTHTYSGNGDKQTGVITVPDDWKIVWTCDARNNYGVQGFIGISVYNSDGTASYAGDVSGNCAANKITTDSSEEHQAGDVYFKVFAGLPWTIQVQEFK